MKTLIKTSIFFLVLFLIAYFSANYILKKVAVKAVAELKPRLEQKGIIIKCQSLRGIAEEAPMAYKDVDNVVQIVHNAGLSKKVAKLKPLAVIKGE